MKQRTNTAKWMEKQGRWQIAVQKNGVRKTFYSSTPGRTGQREANAKADRWLESSGGSAKAARVSVAEAQKEWLEGLRLRTGKSHWSKCELRTNKYMVPVIGHKKVCDVVPADIQKVIDRAYKVGGLSEKSLKNLRGDINNYLKYCRQAGYTTLNPEGISIPHGARKPEKKILTPEDISKVFSCSKTIWRGLEVEDRLANAYRLALVTGLRPGELLALTRDNVSGPFIQVQGSMNDLREHTAGKNQNALRVIFKTARDAQIIADQLAQLKREGIVSPLLFPGKNGRDIRQRTYRTAWYRFCEHNGIAPISPYEMRHTFVSATKKMPEGLKKLVIGHSDDMDTEGVYGHLMTGDLEEAAAFIQGAFDEILEKK